MSSCFRPLHAFAVVFAVAVMTLCVLPIQAQWSSGDYPVNAFALSHDGTRMAVAGRAIDSAETTDGEYYPIDIYDVATGKLVDTLNPIWPLTNNLALNAQGTLLAYKTATGVQVTEVSTRKRIYSLELEDRDYVARFVWSPVGSWLLVLTQNGKIYLFDARKSDAALELRDLAQLDKVVDVDWSGDSAEIALLIVDQTIHFWDISARKITRSIQCNCAGKIAWQPNGRAIAVTNDTLIRMVNAVTGNTIASIHDDHQYDIPLSIAWSQDGKRIAIGTYYGGLLLYDSNLKTIAVSYPTEVNSVFWSAGGDVFYTGPERGIYRNGEPVTLDMSAIQTPQVAHVHQTVSYDIFGMGISRDGTKLTVSGRSLWYGNGCSALYPIDIFSTQTGMLLNTVENVPGVPAQMTFSPDDRMIAYDDNGFNSSIGVIKIASEQVLFEQSNCLAPNRTTRAAWSTDGIRVALSNAFGLDVFDTSQQKVIWHVEAPEPEDASEGRSRFTALDWIAGFDWIATATDDGTIQIWDLTKPIETPGLVYAPFPGGIQVIAANPAQPGLFVAGGEHGVIFLYDIIENRGTGYLQVGDTGTVYGLVWSPDGKSLAAAASNQVTVFDFDSKSILSTYAVSGIISSLAWSGNHDLFFVADHGGLYKNGKPFLLRNQAGESTAPATLMPPPSPAPTYAVEEEWQKGQG